MMPKNALQEASDHYWFSHGRFVRINFWKWWYCLVDRTAAWKRAAMQRVAQAKAIAQRAVAKNRLTAKCFKCGTEFEYVPPMPGMLRDMCDNCTLRWRAGDKF